MASWSTRWVELWKVCAGDHVLLAPPFIVDAAVVDTIVERLGDAIDAATAKAG